MQKMLRLTCAGVLLCLVLLTASADNLLRLYNLVLPAIALILANFVVTQYFLENTRCIKSPPPPLPTDLWSQMVSCLSGIVHYVVGKDIAAADVDDVSCEYHHNMLFVASVMNHLAFASGLVTFITATSSKVERVTLIIFVNSFIVPCALQLVGASKSDVELANTLVCRVVGLGMDIWSCVCLERMLRTSVRFMSRNDVDLGWTLVALWYRARSALLVSWLLAYSTQLLDSLMAADVPDITVTELMLFNLRHRSWSPMMYLGLCSATGYLTDAVWKSVYVVVTRSAARLNVTDNGLSEVLTLVHARLICFLLDVSTAEMFSFAIPFLAGLLAVRWIFRAVKALLLSDDRTTRIAACLVYIATIIAPPSFVCFTLYGEERVYFVGNLLIALRFSIRGASTLVKSFVKRWYATADVGDAEDVIVVITVSTEF